MSRMVLGRLRADEGLRDLRLLVRWDVFREKDPAFLEEIAGLLVFSFACALRNVLMAGADLTVERKKLSTRLDVLRRGSLKEELQ